MSQQRPVRRSSARPWSVPIALGFGPEPFDGAAILDEMSGERALLVWQILRDVDVWLEQDRRESRILFSSGAGIDRVRQIDALFPREPTVHDALRTLAALLEGPVRGTGISAACATLARWANDQELARTAFAAALRAAAASPRNPGYCHLAGVLACRSADYMRAEAWLCRSLVLARRASNARRYGLSLMSLAGLHRVRCEAGLAMRRLRQALRAARRFALRDVRALAYHDLFLVTSTHGSSGRAARYALSAARAYGRDQARLPALAQDVARFFLLRERAPCALRLLRAIDERALHPRERLRYLSTLARAAGAAGDEPTFRRAWNDLWQWLDARAADARAAEALVNLARGAARLHDPERVTAAAREAHRIAILCGARRELAAAERMLEGPAGERMAELPPRARCSDTEIADASAAAELLIGRLLQATGARSSPAETAAIP